MKYTGLELVSIINTAENVKDFNKLTGILNDADLSLQKRMVAHYIVDTRLTLNNWN